MYFVHRSAYDGPLSKRVVRLPEPTVLAHVGLPGLAGYLRCSDPGRHPGWPDELLVLRALVAPDETAIEPALRRCNRWPGFRLDASRWPDRPDDHAAAHTAAMEQPARRGSAPH